MIELPTVDRRHDVDALRVFAFSLLILYHIGMFYVQDWDWHVKSAYQAQWLQLPMLLVNQWRMPLLFLISGLAVSFVWSRYTQLELVARRSARLLLPLVFGMAFVVAPQPYFEALSNGVVERGFIEFMGRYLSFQDFPGEAWGGEDTIVWTWNHLWYLPYVLLYTIALVPVMAWLSGGGQGVHRRLQRLRGFDLVLLPVLPLMLYGLYVYPSFPYISHALLDDAYAHVMYGTFFLYGFIIASDRDLWNAIARLRWWLTVAALVSFTVFFNREVWLLATPSPLTDILELFVVYLNRWLWILTILAWGHHLVRRPLPGMAYATEAVFCWYILHQTITVTAGYQLSRLELGPVVEPLLVLLLTVGGCALLHEFLIRRVNVLRPLFGMRRKRRQVPS